jgi:hypothetical protein
MPTVFEDDELRGPLQWRSTLQHGIAAIAYYLLAFFHLVLAFLKKQPHQRVGHHPMISNRGTATALNREDPSVAMPSVSEDGNKGTICSKGFMPNLKCFMSQSVAGPYKTIVTGTTSAGNTSLHSMAGIIMIIGTTTKSRQC